MDVTETKTSRFVHVTLKHMESDAGSFEAVIDTESRHAIDHPDLTATYYRSYSRPEHGRAPLDVTRNGNVFWSDPRPHTYGMSICFHGTTRKVVADGDVIEAGEKVQFLGSEPIFTPSWITRVEGAFLAATKESR